MEVIVTEGIQVTYSGEVYRNGATADVPDAVAHRWIHNGWASIDGHPLRDPRGLADGAPYHGNPHTFVVHGESELVPNAEPEPEPEPEPKSTEDAATEAKVARSSAARQSRVRRDPRKVKGRANADK